MKGEDRMKLRSCLKAKTILVVDDNELNRKIIGRLITAHCGTVQMAVNGQEAVRSFLLSAPGEIDAVIMDIRMPFMNGWDAAAAIRSSSHPDAGRIPILALTSEKKQEDRAKGRQSGMNAYLFKPFDPQELLRVLVENINR